MKRKELMTLALVVFLTAIISLILAGALFNSPAKRSAKVPVVPVISSSFPDVKNDPNYNFFLNEKALDPTQTIQIGGSPNNSPFNTNNRGD